MKDTIINGQMFHVRISYSNGKHLYANIFPLKKYEQGVKLNTIKGYRKMNRLERFIFKNCL